MGTCIITGAGSGIGKEVALCLGTQLQFDKIALLGRNIEALNSTKVQMTEKGMDVSLWECDLSFPERLPHIVEAVYEKCGSIDCLLNIAGYTEPQPVFGTTLENMQLTYAVNVFSPFVLMRESARYMKKHGGKILNVASTAGMTPRPGWISYASSKAAMISISQTLSDELAEYGIKVYCVSPGRCATKLRRRLAPEEDASKIMQPQEVAEIICGLISEKECCMDGQNIVIRKQISR